MIPGLSPVHLPQDAAAYAENVYIGKGDALYPEFEPRDIGAVLYAPDGSVFTGTARTIWQSDGDWFAWPFFVNVEEDPRHYGSEQAFLYVQDGSLWRMSGAWRQAGRGAQRLGVSRPTDNPVATLMGERDWAIPFPPVSDIPNPPVPPTDPIEDGSQPGEVRAYVYTLVNTMDEESAPSLPSAPILVPPKTNVGVRAAYTEQKNIKAWRWYRSLPNTNELEVSYRFVAETELPELLDTQDPLSLGDEIITTQHYALTDQIPSPKIKGIARLGETQIVAWSERELFLSQPRLPHAYAPRDRQRLPYSIVTLRSSPSIVEGVSPDPQEEQTIRALAAPDPSFVTYILTDERPFVMSLYRGLTLREISVDEPCLSETLAVSAEGTCTYVSTRGIVQISSHGAQGVTDEIFTSQGMDTLGIVEAPQDWTLGYNQERYFLLGPSSSWVFIQSDYAKDRVLSWSASTVSGTALTGRREAALFFVTDGHLMEWGAGPNRMRAIWRSRNEQMSEYFNPGAIKVDMPMGSPAEAVVTFWRNGLPWARKTCLSQRPARLPRQGKGLYWTMEVATSEIVYRIMAEKSIGDLATPIQHRLEG